jgi:phage shock protein PspC (stress-responsive transcriptional regulator)
MKKNISINISGIIFHIEEDGYDTLKKYLDSINKYFSTFEDSSEILADIESRIAEIFLSRLNEEKQVITTEDVNSLVATMGSVSDFKAAEDQETVTEPTPGAKEHSYSGETTDNTFTGEQTPPKTFTPSKKLMRDQKRKVLGGVCAGLGNYFNIDPLWVRLIFAVLLFFYGITFFAYIIMWIIVPGSFDLEEPITEKRMFRDPGRKVIGGVAAGVAQYFNVDIIAMRIIFVVFTIFGGLGLFFYIVLWIILPEARSLTDRVQMQGEPVTLSNIESTIKKDQFDRVETEESTLTKILLFPFRLIGMILSGLGKVLAPLMELIRVAIGIVIVFVGLALVFGVVVTGGVLLGLFSAAAFSLPWMPEFQDATIPMDVFMRAFPGWVAFAGFLASLVPSIFLILLGVSIIAKRIVFNATAGWTLFVLFFVSVILLGVGVPKIVFNFKERGEYRTENTYIVKGKRAVFRVNEVGMDDYDAINLTLRGHDSKEFRLIQTFKAQGTTRQRGIENAKMIDYNVEFKDDSIFIFDSNFKFKEDAIFRGQNLAMTLFVPYNTPFTMDEGMSRMITQYVDWNYLDGYTWKMTDDGLECLNCQGKDNNDDDYDDQESTSLRDFDELELTGKFDVKISNGGDFNVDMVGSEKEKAKYKIYKSGSTLVIEYNGQRNFNWNVRDFNLEAMRINITMPSLERLEATGFGTVRFDEFSSDDLDIEIRGPIRLRGEMRAMNLNLTMTGKGEADLSGSATRMNARLELASKLRAYNMDVVDAIVEASGASSAKVNVSGTLEMEETGLSNIDFRGSPNIVKRD